MTLGTPLEINIGEVLNAGTEKTIIIKYITKDGNKGLNWFTPMMTFGRRHPFLFSDTKPILGRSIVPCQDTPSAKVFFKAKINVPKPLVGIVTGMNTYIEDEGNTTTYYYSLPNQPISTYLIAIAAGDLQQRPVSGRTSVWAEQEIIENTVKEFADIETYFQTVICF
jgi:leukotriene-A4 hydrolase